MTWETIGIGTVTSAAFALLPDIDEPGSTVSRKLGFISEAISNVARSVSGGHRQATHSLFFAAIVGGLAYFANGHRWPMSILVVAAFLLALRMILPRVLRFSSVLLLLPLVGGWWAYYHPLWPLSVLLLTTAGGVVWHMIGDSLTVEGVPWLWLPFVRPLKNLRLSFPLIGHCGSERESLLAVLMSLGVIWLSFRLIAIPAYHSGRAEWSAHGNISFLKDIFHRQVSGLTNDIGSQIGHQLSNVKNSVVTPKS
jgi:membrane-bound metal-dependent hydrolase YbcI (DUF457 family)